MAVLPFRIDDSTEVEVRRRDLQLVTTEFLVEVEPDPGIEEVVARILGYSLDSMRERTPGNPNAFDYYDDLLVETLGYTLVEDWSSEWTAAAAMGDLDQGRFDFFMSTEDFVQSLDQLPEDL